MAEFKGNVVAVETSPYWDEALASIELKQSKVNGMAYFLRTEHQDHANKDGKIQALIGKAFAEAMLEMEEN